MKRLLLFTSLVFLLSACSPAPPQPPATPINPIQAFNAADAHLKGDKSCWEKLRRAADANDLRQVKYLIEHGCVIDGQKESVPYNSHGAIWIAVQRPSLDMLEMLLAMGLDPCQESSTGPSALALAAALGSLEMLDFLIGRCGNLDESQGIDQGGTPLTQAIEKGSLEKVRLLLDSGASIEPDTLAFRRSPLNAAIQSQRISIIELLLDRGADIHAKTSEGLYDDCIACPGGVTVLHTLVGLYSNRPINRAHLNKILALLLARGADLNAESNYGMTPLEHVCYGTDTALVSKLIKLGAKLETQGYSALHCAAQFSNTLMVAHLLKLGADPNVKTQRGETPLVVSFYCCGDGFGEGITDEARIATSRLLLQYGADPNAKSPFTGYSIPASCKTGRRKALCEAVFAEYY